MYSLLSKLANLSHTPMRKERSNTMESEDVEMDGEEDEDDSIEGSSVLSSTTSMKRRFSDISRNLNATSSDFVGGYPEREAKKQKMLSKSAAAARCCCC